MTGEFEVEARLLLTRVDEVAVAVNQLYSNAIDSSNRRQDLQRIMNTYPRAYLERIIGHDLDHIVEYLADEGEQ